MSDQNVLLRVRELINQIGELVAPVQAQSPVVPQNNNSILNPTIPLAGNYTPRPALPSTSVISELRTRFQPYPIEGQRFRLAGRSAGRRSLPIPRTWNQRFYCLGGPNDLKTPLPSRREILAFNGLGEAAISTSADGTSMELQQKIREQYPKLIGDFELLRASAGGFGKSLHRACNNMPVPDVTYLKTLRVTTIYIRPEQEIELLIDNQTNGDQTAELHRTQLNSNNSIDSSEQAAGISTSYNEHLNIQNADELHSINEPGAGTSISSNQSLNIQNASTLEDDFTTMEEFREKIYLSNPGDQYITVKREGFLQKLLTVYKNPEFNYNRKPKIEFAGELGGDIGGPSREYFWKGFTSLMNEKFDGRALFEGQADHKLPAVDARLLRSGIMETVGKFMAHAAIHCGIAFIGLSEAAAEYLSVPEVDFDTPFTIYAEDVPDTDYRNAIENIQKIKSGATLTHEESCRVQEAALSSDFLDIVKKDNANEALEHILYYQVIERRKPYLDAIKKAFRATNLIDFLSPRPYLRAAVFPRSASISYPPNLIKEKIVCIGPDVVLSYVKDFIDDLTGDGQIQKLLCGWTGWPVIPEGELRLNVLDVPENIPAGDPEGNRPQFNVQTCFNEIAIPSDSSKPDVYNYLNLLIENFEGFGNY